MGAKVLPFAREASKESPLSKKLREIQRANDQFWSAPAPHVVQAGLAFAQLKKAQQQTRAKKPRHVARNRRIHDLAAEGKPANVIAKTVGKSERQVRKILAKPRVRELPEK